ICETLNKAILTLPPELGVEKINDWEEVDDADFVMQIFHAYEKEFKAFDERLKKNKNSGSIERPGHNPGSVPPENFQDATRDIRDTGSPPETISTRSRHTDDGLFSTQEASSGPHADRRDSQANPGGNHRGESHQRYEGRGSTGIPNFTPSGRHPQE
ncbi:hypothetical protein, partial [Leptospira levettii]|uniref:hypothetical protein n=1 Tax=Leptospira levettii TaxID=2023178 RepID=UPI000CBB3D9C